MNNKWNDDDTSRKMGYDAETWDEVDYFVVLQRNAEMNELWIRIFK